MTFSTEVTIYETNDTLRDNPDLVIPAFDILAKADGAHVPFFYGKQVENPNTAYVFVDWVDTPAHRAFVSGSTYPDMLSTFKPHLPAGGKAEMYHVHFPSTIALRQPVTEVFVLTLKAPEHRAAVVELLSAFSEQTKDMLTFGQTEEDENKYVVLGGWPSVEAHWETSAKPEVAAAITKLLELANREHLFHVKLTQYDGLRN